MISNHEFRLHSHWSHDRDILETAYTISREVSLYVEAMVFLFHVSQSRFHRVVLNQILNPRLSYVFYLRRRIQRVELLPIPSALNPYDKSSSSACSSCRFSSGVSSRIYGNQTLVLTEHFHVVMPLVWSISMVCGSKRAALNGDQGMMGNKTIPITMKVPLKYNVTLTRDDMLLFLCVLCSLVHRTKICSNQISSFCYVMNA